jgi:cysteinyl-tRNA synthetase
VDPDPDVIDALADDLNTPRAIARLHELRKAGRGAALLASARVMGLMTMHPSTSVIGCGPMTEEQQRLADRVATIWAELRERRDFPAADRLKRQAADAGVELRATRTATGQGATATLAGQVDLDRLRELVG